MSTTSVMSKNQKAHMRSPIHNETELLQTIASIHASCMNLCKQSVGKYLPVAGNIGIFCHDDDEYRRLVNIQKNLTDMNTNVYGKYFLLHTPITIPKVDDIPAATYTYLYIRKPDANKPQAGDVDFFMEPDLYAHLKASLLKGTPTPGMRVLDRPDLDLIECYDPSIDALGYIGAKKVPEDTSHI